MQAQIYPIMTPAECEEQRVLLETQEWKEGKARTEELTGFIKKNKELKPKIDGELVTAVSAKITQKMVSNVEFNSRTCLLKMTGVKFNKFDAPEKGEVEQEYKRHTDAPWMGPVRTDFTVVLLLSDPDTFDGGLHCVQDPLTNEIWEFELKQGECLVYETGYAHWVTPLTKGTRICALGWVESQITSERERGLLNTLRVMSHELEVKMLAEKDVPEYRKWFVDVGVVHSGLYRLWGHRL